MPASPNQHVRVQEESGCCAVLRQSNRRPVAVLNHNKAAFYMIEPAFFKAMLEGLVDQDKRRPRWPGLRKSAWRNERLQRAAAACLTAESESRGCLSPPELAQDAMKYVAAYAVLTCKNLLLAKVLELAAGSGTIAGVPTPGRAVSPVLA
ncbi:MAG: hypothetical protein LH479_13615 [Polaromonas sp.]|nr:hypothetical protein [Polaromonas sp.]